jgi:drug/metabolite transporter (DMT)-like permease
MRVLQISGVILVVVGLFLILRPPSYSRDESVVKLGDFEAKVQQQHTVPGWVGGALLGAGGVLVIFGLRKSS